MKIKKKINTSFESAAAFWSPEDPDDRSTGILTVRRGRIAYTTAPKYEVLGGEAIGQKFVESGSLRRAEYIPCLQGRTQEEVCSVFSLTELENPGVLDFRSGENLSSTKYDVRAAVMGLQLSGLRVEEIDGASYQFTDVSRWLPSAWSMKFSDNDTVYTVPRKTVECFSFGSLHLSAEVQCKVGVSGKNKVKGKTSLTPVPFVRITPVQPRSLEWFVHLSSRLENFFSLFLGTSVTPKNLKLVVGDDTGWLIRHGRRRRQKTKFQLWIRSEPHVIAKALASWLAVPEAEMAVEQVLLGTLRKSSLFVETEFLSLAQGLEAFGRLHFDSPLVPVKEFRTALKQVKETIRTTWGNTPVTERCAQLLSHANETSYADRLRRTCELLPPEFLLQAFGSKEDLVRKIVKTRNYFTHLGIVAETHVVREPNDLFLLNQKLTALLRCVVLLKLEVPFDNLRDPIAYQAKRWS